jgi:hypothetical protein
MGKMILTGDDRVGQELQEIGTYFYGTGTWNIRK